MPSYTGQAVAEEARNSYLNRGGVSDEKMLAIINTEYEDLQNFLIENDAPTFNTIFAPITVPALAISIPEGGAAGQLPLDFVEPRKLWERSVGGAETDWVPMKERRILPQSTANNTLGFWNWSGEVVNLIGASSIRQVRIFGIKSLPLLSDLKDPIAINFSKTYMAAAIAAKAALTVLHNPTLAKSIRTEADLYRSRLLSKHTRKNQSLPVRRQGMRRRGF